jgi:single-stranded-DNA-specific exonuclease
MTALLTSIAEALGLHPSIGRVLEGRGIRTPEQAREWLEPPLARLGSVDRFPDLPKAVARLRRAIEDEQPIAIYADRDVDGLSGLAILLRTLRTLGATVIWGAPIAGRGLQRPVLERLAAQAKVLILVDCGTGETAEIAWLAGQGIDVIVADHHRMAAERPAAFAWVHPASVSDEVAETCAGTAAANTYAPAAPDLIIQGDGTAVASTYAPAGCVMAFKLAQALWISFLGADDAERLDYFLFDHLDVLALGILADRVPLTGENRIFVWHGLRRLARTRKGGLASLLRFFRLLPRATAVSVREASWQIIPMLNAAGRLGQPRWAVDLLLTEEPWVASDCINQLLALNSQRRTAQHHSLEAFEKSVAEQCLLETDAVLIAMADGLEPSVTGLAAQSLARKYGRPTFLFVQQGEQAVGSARGLDDIDLFAWVEEHRHLLVKYGGHEGAVGLTIRMADFDLFRRKLLDAGKRQSKPAAGGDVAAGPEAEIALSEANEAWWEQLQRLEPFGPGFPCPVFRLTGITSIRPVSRPRVPGAHTSKPRAAVFWLEGEGTRALAEMDSPPFPLSGVQPGPWTAVGHAVAARKEDALYKWILQEVAHG